MQLAQGTMIVTFGLTVKTTICFVHISDYGPSAPTSPLYSASRGLHTTFYAKTQLHSVCSMLMVKQLNKEQHCSSQTGGVACVGLYSSMS